MTEKPALSLAFAGKQTLPAGLKTGTPLPDPCLLDYRFAPADWQTSICLPDDWQKSLVSKQGEMLYSFPGRYEGFGTRIQVKADWTDETEVTREQRLLSARVPVVVTTERGKNYELTLQSFAVARPEDWPATPTADALHPAEEARRIERVGECAMHEAWANPESICGKAFRDVDYASGGALRYRFKPRNAGRHTIALGFCEAHCEEPGQRVMQFMVDGREEFTVDPVADPGFNVPFTRKVTLENLAAGEWVEFELKAAPDAANPDVALAAIWVFEGDAPEESQVVLGAANRTAAGFFNCGRSAWKPGGAPRADLILATLTNTCDETGYFTPCVRIHDESGCTYDEKTQTVSIPGGPALRLSHKIDGLTFETTPKGEFEDLTTLLFKQIELAPGASERFVVACHHGADPQSWSVRHAEAALAAARRYWEELALPYGAITVPDPDVQALLEGALRNIYQAREIKAGSPCFQVGPTCYRGLWIIDGAFILETITQLGRADEVRAGVEQMLGHQRANGGLELIGSHWKETGIALWVIDRHAALTDDEAWLASKWDNVTRAWDYIRELRRRASQDPEALDYGLLPPGMSDGGLLLGSEYTNLYWVLIGMRSAIDVAKRLGRKETAGQWQDEYDSLWKRFEETAERDRYTDDFGNEMLPIAMERPLKEPEQKAQWAFLHTIYPGRLFGKDDALALGTLANLTAHESEGLVFATGWDSKGVWNYFGSFYAHAMLELGAGEKAAHSLYALGNHASPTFVWREEQNTLDQPVFFTGDMPHNWASAEFIRTTLHLIAFERDEELHLLEGLPGEWLKPGAEVRLNGVLTQFGSLSLHLGLDGTGTNALLRLAIPERGNLRKVVVHGFSVTGELPATLLPGTTLDLELKRI